MYKKCISFIVLISLLTGFSGCNFKINKSVHISENETVNHSLNTINGSIYIDSGCIIKGKCRSVNGSIRIGDNSQVDDLDAVNGSIEINREVTVHGSIKSINGAIKCGEKCRIYRDIYSINGDIDIINTLVKNDIKTINGDITLWDKSHVEGDIIIKRKKGSGSFHNISTIKIKITEGSIVDGDIIAHKDERLVKVILSKGGQVLGRIRNAEVVKL